MKIQERKFANLHRKKIGLNPQTYGTNRIPTGIWRYNGFDEPIWCKVKLDNKDDNYEKFSGVSITFGKPSLNESGFEIKISNCWAYEADASKYKYNFSFGSMFLCIFQVADRKTAEKMCEEIIRACVIE